MPGWEDLKLFGADSLFGEDALGNLLAAAFGAFAGAAIAARSQNKRAAIAELNAVSTARTLCFSIVNVFVGLKRQHIRRLRTEYLVQKREFLSIHRRAAQGGPPQAFNARMDLQTLIPPVAPIELLERTLFENTSIRGAPLAAAVALVNAVTTLRQSLESRNDLIEEVRSLGNISTERKLQLYFGLPSPLGVDERFSAYIKGIYCQTDDCIFFARTLEDHLFRYATRLDRRYRWRYWLRLPRPGTTDWTAAERQRLIPSKQKYQSWLSAFRHSPTNWQRFLASARTIVTW